MIDFRIVAKWKSNRGELLLVKCGSRYYFHCNRHCGSIIASTETEAIDFIQSRIYDGDFRFYNGYLVKVQNN